MDERHAERLLHVFCAIDLALGQRTDEASVLSNVGILGHAYAVACLGKRESLLGNETHDFGVRRLKGGRKSEMDVLAVKYGARAYIHIPALGIRDLHKPRFQTDRILTIGK